MIQYNNETSSTSNIKFVSDVLLLHVLDALLIKKIIIKLL